MFEKKRILFLLATSALLVSCGGGGTDTPSTTAAASTGGGTSTNGSSGAQPGGGTTAANSSTPAAGSTTTGKPPANSGGSTTPVPAAVDQKLNGYVEVVANQIMYIRRNRIIYLPVVMSEFESDRGIVDVASGSPVAHIDGLEAQAAAAGCNRTNDGTCAVQPPAAAPAAPIAAFGIRVSKYVLPTATGQAVGNQTVVGRIAIDLTERTDSPGLSANEVPEIMRFVIDKVELSTNQNGELASVKVQDGAQIHVYGRSAGGVEVRENIPAPAGTVRILPMVDVPDNHGDTTSFFLMLDLETGFSQAGRKLAALENIAGHFAMHLTLSSLQELVRPAAGATADSPALERKELVGQSITVNDQPPVSGAGINGNAWIRMYPPQ